MGRPSIITLHRHEAPSVTLELPEAHDDDDRQTKFDRIARLIQKEWSARATATSPKPSLAPIPWLSKTAYDVLRALLDEGFKELFNERIREHRRHLHGPRKDLNPFQLGLMALFADYPEAKKRNPQTKRVGASKPMTPQTRERIGKELWYAYRHYVPPEFLLGFLSQVRSPGLERRSADGDVEPGFEEWIVECRAAEINDDGSGCDDRGTYPKKIEKAVESRIRGIEMNEIKRLGRYGPNVGRRKIIKDEEDGWDN